ncbi:hypothetical protein [Marinigracilibium pacificum]|uniref:Outer membrane protein beta-barrel domain-containing protein n=1 Tax=Marinigracilibium pacificum TaxID=2729599 RepID=A0A848IW08_9BACT|nr:hypothetical protein [Marinigracilibium pacificum]NMM47358.1 hypothetical protein [Marinigracilibium pacificum]
MKSTPLFIYILLITCFSINANPLFKSNSLSSEELILNDTTDFGDLTRKERRQWRIDHYTGKLFFNLSIPYANHFTVTQENHRITDSGFLGISAGLDYYYNENQFISLNVGQVTNYYFLPIPIYVPLWFDQIQTKYISLSHNHKLGRHKLGYGINYSIDRIYPKDSEESSFIKSVDNKSLGLVGSYHLQLGRAFHLGLIYRPTFISLDEFNSSYQHSISFDIAWKIRLIK